MGNVDYRLEHYAVKYACQFHTNRVGYVAKEHCGWQHWDLTQNRGSYAK
jgi:hypothetical protein